MYLGCCSIVVIAIQELVVMSGYFSLHVVHASITKFDVVGVANFMKSVGLWEGLLNDSQELFSNISFYIFTEGWVKPCDFSVPKSIEG